MRIERSFLPTPVPPHALCGWVVRLTDAPLELENPAHLDALGSAYERFPAIGGRSTP
ncbi:DUF5953 family protein [Melittangium boletus]|uniref:DUF5953 family protein n=1 Tax=Melittangium boletus TaxID=83453 RepID=UPI001FE992DC|nr:DUF5953 family protein [Melittangium boletus]